MASGPPTPSDLPTANLPHLTFSTLTSTSLLSACQTHGIFYLALPTHTTSSIHSIRTLSERLFALSPSILQAHDIDTLSPLKLSGYKPLGRNRAGLASNKDGFETYAIPKDGIMGLSQEEQWARPGLIDEYMDALREYCDVIHEAAEAIFRALSSALELEIGLGTLHRSAEVRSPDIVRLLRYHPVKEAERGEGVSHIAHTDLGTLTFLSTRQWGLQMLGSGEKEKWEWVKPPHDDATVIVNVGDMLSMLTGGKLKSVLHRVVPVLGREEEERRSFVYLMRAEEDVKMAPILSRRRDSVGQNGGKGELLTSGDWLRRKFMMLRGSTWDNEKSWILSGVREVQA